MVGAAGFGVLMLSFALGDGLLEVASERRTGGLVLLGAVLAPLFVLGAAVLAARPDQVVLRPDGVEVRRAARSTTVAWDDLVGVELAGGPADSVVLRGRTGRAVPVPTRYLPVDGARLHGVLEHFRARPGERAGLGTASVPELVAAATTGPPARPAGPGAAS